MNQKELTKTVMMISNRKKHTLASKVFIKKIQRFKLAMLLNVSLVWEQLPTCGLSESDLSHMDGRGVSPKFQC